MSSYVEVRGVKIGEGVPKICVPIVGKTKEEILAAAKSFADVKMDVVEWRVDWFDGVFDFAQVEDVLKDLRPALGNTPILFTFRTSKEGGEKAIEPDVYVELNRSSKLHMKRVWQLSLLTMILTRHRTKMISLDVSAKCRN